MQKAFDGNYLTFVEVIRRCLGEERLLVQSCEEDVKAYYFGLMLLSIYYLSNLSNIYFAIFNIRSVLCRIVDL